jgi:nitrogen fixation/metabolism regulation signal transduction histidine kinase
MLIIKIILINLLFIASFFLLLPQSPWLFLFTTCGAIFLTVMLLHKESKQQQKTLQAIFNGLQNLQDGDFSISLSENIQQKKNAEQHQLITLFNQVTDKLRLEKQSLYQRELLLDKVVNASDVVTVLVNHRNTIIFANRAAQHFFHSTNLMGQQWAELLATQMPELLQHHDKNNAIIQLMIKDRMSGVSHDPTLGDEDKTEESWHLARHLLKLHNSNHQLILLKPLTKELHQQELQTWKKVIKVINHELNNSIAPISSMCHSGLILAERLNEPKLDRVFNTISGRINKLSEFIKSYSQLARLSIPQKTPFNIINTIDQLKSLYQLEFICSEKVVLLNADESQIEQLLINLLKNAREFSPNQSTEVTLNIHDDMLNIVIRDYGNGMSQEVMKKAFLPYYSTKVDGSGIGLSLCREVVDAHHGQITLNNHPKGGLQVTVCLSLNGHMTFKVS